MPPHAAEPTADLVRKDLLTAKEVAVIMDVHVNTVRNLIAARKLRAIVVGRLVKVRRSAIAEYYRTHER